VPGSKPPAEWFSGMIKEVKEGNPDYSDVVIKKTVGDIWYNELSDAKRKEILNRYEASYKGDIIVRAKDVINVG